jgi:hypothetical protein
MKLPKTSWRNTRRSVLYIYPLYIYTVIYIRSVLYTLTYKEPHDCLSCEFAIALRLWTATLYPVEIADGQNFGERQVTNNHHLVGWKQIVTYEPCSKAPIRFGRPPRAAGLKIVRVSLTQRVSVYGIGGLLFAGISSCQLNWSVTSLKVTL